MTPGGTITHRYYESSTAVINGFSAIVPNPEALSGFKSSFAGDLDYIEEDGTVTTQ
ncbi:hypothetical protein BOTBODRAFT_31946 [Botryobasidium botryosum FD-172 SS1]|uniref:Uncharacterized protein n=1 Tax=Botryobasidium botryosum (strain FD-172 SS1) TaxID=930990 RepID=A0A067MKP1_BOTB1|nr:hypothetical protein BOTBODRAFT_31946 [Botryobasidium botryosum FD-172 SS1]